MLAAIDPSGTIVATNASWCRVLGSVGVDPSEYEVGARYVALCERAAANGVTAATEMAAALESLLRGSEISRTVEFFSEFEPERRAWKVSFNLIPEADGTVLVTVEDTTSAERLARSVEGQGRLDPATGLAVPSVWMEGLALRLRRTPAPRSVAVVSVEPIGFNRVVAMLGRWPSDDILGSLGTRLVAIGDGWANATRLEDHRFAFDVSAVNDGGARAVELARSATSIEFITGHLAVSLTAAVGLACNVEGDEGPDQLLERSLAALATDAETLGRSKPWIRNLDGTQQF
jgi:predicted signal transduction protein with EAL and GGDEF domain